MLSIFLNDLKSIYLLNNMRNLLIIFATLLFFSSCKVFRPNLMLKTPRDFKYDKLVDSLSALDYKISPNDILMYRIYSNKGYKLIDLTNSSNSGVFRNEVDIMVQSDGNVKMPLLGNILVGGLTIKQAETLLEEEYAKYYIDPYINLKINNKRIIIFPGNGGQARVLPLQNNNTSVLESIANAGGILEDGKAYKVKLIRENPKDKEHPFVYLMDLSEIDGINAGRSIVQAGDIIYVEPRYRPFVVFNREVGPIVTLVTSLLILYQFSRIATQ